MYRKIFSLLWQHNRICLAFTLLIFSSAVFTQQSPGIRGTVISEANRQPLQGVTVLLKGTDRGTVTDASGKFNINASPADTLVFRYIGYADKNIAAGSTPLLNISLSTSTYQLNDVVVVGYGTQRKSELTGAISSVSASEIKNLPARSLAEAHEADRRADRVLRHRAPRGRLGHQPTGSDSTP